MAPGRGHIFQCLAIAMRLGKLSWATFTLYKGTPKSTGKFITFCHKEQKNIVMEPHVSIIKKGEMVQVIY